MSEHQNQDAERQEIEMLLPWYVMGRLDRADAARVEACLARDPSLERQFQLIREEYDQSLHGNEAIPDRPARNAERLLAEVARRRAPRKVAGPSLWSQVKDFLALPPTGAVRWAGAAAALLIVLQAGIIGTLAVRQSQTFVPASGGDVATDRGTVAFVGFVGGATTAAVVDFLAAQDMTILDGPTGGYFTVRIGPRDMSEAARNAKIEALKSRSDIVAAAVLLR